MSSSEIQIANLLGRYAEYIDSGDFAGAARLFEHAKVRLKGRELDSRGLKQLWDDVIIKYPDGTPRTKHVITNLIIEADEARNTGTCRSYYTVIQLIDGKLEVIAAGRYHDWFERVNGIWRWSSRDYSLLDLDTGRAHHNRPGP